MMSHKHNLSDGEIVINFKFLEQMLYELVSP